MTGLFKKLRKLVTPPLDNPRLLKAQYIALARQLPLMYFILIVNTWALVMTHLDNAPDWLAFYIPVAMTLICGIRGASWWRMRHHPPAPELIARALVRTNLLAPPIATAFTFWSLALFPYGDIYAQSHVAFYMAITVIGVIFSMMHLRPAAQSTALIVNVVFVVFFSSMGNTAFTATALNVLLVSMTMLVILNNHYRAFTRLVDAQAKAEQLSDENLKLANEDSLTGLPNRRQFFSTLDREMANAEANGSRLAVGIIDLDGFKPVNDQFGHSVGDRLLAQVGQRLNGLLEDGMHLARLGGDEFALILANDADDQALAAFGQRVCEALATPFLLTDLPVQIGGSLGMATFPDMATNAIEAFEYADYALYHSKRTNRGALSMFTACHHQQLLHEGVTEQALRRADIEQEFHLVFQPVIDLRTQRTVSFEALARWQSPKLGDVSPYRFIPVAERIGLINRLTPPLLRKALATANGWPADIRLSFNLSAHDCASDEVAQQIVEVIVASGFDPRRLDLEITETATMQDIVQVQRTIDGFRRLGCGISLDDFGTGYSSLSQLHSLAFTKIKIDRSFVTGLHEKPASYKIVKSLVALSLDMQLDCIVEGVETQPELDALASLGCSLVQGYYYSRPMSPASVEAWLDQENTTERAQC
ncbi:diguanylate cyclase/phosphodiesterase [Pseudomonas asplenii]|uniref:Diguanylate cyclase/phosphodiesterase n=1 Tax=Pseudomonas asplenii TaxID=53407 RepID=A0A0M9GHW0_9PSED|nr:EAL domain-containing protein [Pseudomonas fuscovaginae]KPA91602.1 diguanylate cyclase/phosphodiesterase [Pseudomonas fuscovaginae]